MRTTARPLVFTLLVALAAALAAPPCAWAEPASKDDRVLAREHFKRGEAHQSLGQYDLAISEYLAGYDRAPRPQFLFNIAQCYRLKGDKATAVGYYRRYVAADPNGKGAAEARQHLGELERELAEQAAADAARPPEPEPEPVAPPAPAPKAAVAAPAPAPLVAPPVVPVDEQATRRARVYKITGLASMGTGVVAALVGVGYTVKMQGFDYKVEHPDDMMFGDDDMQNYRDGERAAMISYIFYGVGGGLAITGAVLYWRGTRDGADAQPGRAMTLSPLVGPGVAGVAASGSF